jgi:hypothetical protein
MRAAFDSKFWDQFHAMCRQKGRSRASVANKLGVNYATFCGWIPRRQFRRDLLPRLEECLGWKLSEREAGRLGIELIDSMARPQPLKKPVSQVLAKINSEYDRLERSLRRYATLSNLLFETLSEGTFFVYTSNTVSPFEFLSPALHSEAAQAIEATRRSVARAILNGCLCLYVRPSRYATDYLRAWRYDQLMTPEEVKSGMAAFEQFVVREAMQGAALGNRLSEREAVERVRRHVLQCTIDKCPMWMPGFALAMIGWMSYEEVHTAMTMSLPGRRFGGILCYPPYYTLRFRYLGFCRQLCEQALARLQPGAGGEAKQQSKRRTWVSVQVDKDHRERSEAMAFFKQLHRMLRAVRIADAPYVPPT